MKTLLLFVLPFIFVSCVTFKQKEAAFLSDFEKKYIEFEERSVQDLKAASDKELPELYDKYMREYSALNYELIKFSMKKYKNEQNHYHALGDSYWKRWSQANEESFQRYKLVTAKNAGNYLVSGNETWLAFQNKYVISNVLSRIRKVGRDRSKNELRIIQNELENDSLLLLQGKLNEEQTEWVWTMSINFMSLNLLLENNDLLFYGNIIYWKNNLPDIVNLIKK